MGLGPEAEGGAGFRQSENEREELLQLKYAGHGLCRRRAINVCHGADGECGRADSPGGNQRERRMGMTHHNCPSRRNTPAQISIAKRMGKMVSKTGLAARHWMATAPPR